MESKRSNNDDNALQIMQSISNELKSTSDNFERANLLRQAGVLLFRESAKSSEDLASFALKDVLNSYSKVVTSTEEGSVNNYTGEVARLLKTAHSLDVNKWSTTINSFDSENLLTNKKCQGDYEDCKHREVSSKDLEKIRNSKPEKSHETQTLNSPISSKQETHSYYVRQPTLNSGPNQILNPAGTSSKQPTINSIFKTAREEFTLQSLKKLGHASGSTTNHNQQHQHQPLFSYGASKRSLGFRRTIQDQFVPPVRPACQEFADNHDYIESSDDRLKHIDPKMIELISSEIMSKFKPVAWDDIAGLEYAKSIIQEAVVWPLLRPDIFTGLRRPPRGILLFGPPGTGKTLIGKCIASQSKSTFFSISSSSLTSKWIGDGEKMVRALFAVAAAHQPSVIFIDEVDSLLCQRSATEHESSRRLKTEFLVQLDGAMTSQDERILIVGATNRPQELDEAARRRFIRRLYIPLPEIEARIQILRNLLCSVRHTLSDVEIENVGKLTEGYSGADMESVCREASMEPIRSIPPTKIMSFNEKEVRSISFDDFYTALNRIKASVSQNDLQQYHEWNEVYGSGNVR